MSEDIYIDEAEESFYSPGAGVLDGTLEVEKMMQQIYKELASRSPRCWRLRR